VVVVLFQLVVGRVRQEKQSGLAVPAMATAEIVLASKSRHQFVPPMFVPLSALAAVGCEIVQW